MCSRPIVKNDLVFACRTCNECLTTKKNDWVARSMAEAAQSKNMLVLNLTYNSETQENRDGSKVFNYQHVNSFLKRLRSQANYLTKQTETIRFLCAGENGDKKGRVHWHLVIFSDIDLRQLGKFKDFHTQKKIPNNEVPFDQRLAWTIWPHGLVFLQQADQGGVMYALKYAFKDQFNSQKSQGTMRYSKSERYASNYFRMSKHPPIGWMWLEQKLQKWQREKSLPVHLNLKVPNYSGYWHPKGAIRKRLLECLFTLNQAIKAETGKNAPQFNALKQSLLDQKEQEFLENGTEKEEFDEEEFAAKQRRAVNERETTEQSRRIRKQCYSLRPCADCIALLSPKQFGEYADEVSLEVRIETLWRNTRGKDYDEQEHSARIRLANKPNKYCQIANGETVTKASKLSSFRT